MIRIFIDSSVIVAAMFSSEGGSSKILALCEAGLLEGNVSKHVTDEVGEVLKRKFPEMIEDFENLLKLANLKVLKKVKEAEIARAKNWISDKNDVPILAAAKQLNVDVLITLDIRHFIKDEDVSKKSGLRILTPGEFLRGFVKYGSFYRS